MLKVVGLSLVLLFVAGCISGHKQFFVDERADVGHAVDWDYTVESADLYSSTGDFVEDDLIMFREGYVRIGYSSFSGRLESDDAVLAQAKSIGAVAVITSVEFLDSKTTMTPITTTRAVTTYHSGSAYGGGAYGSYVGSSTTLVPSTTYMPITVDRYDQVATYYAKALPPCLGFLTGEISVEERRALGTNQGVKVAAIRFDSPIYFADVLKGDIILSIDGSPVNERNLGQFQLGDGQSVTLDISRGGERLSKQAVTGVCEG